MKKLQIYFLLMLILTSGSCSRSADQENGTTYVSQVATVRKRLKGTSYNKDYCILIDFSRHSGRKRMFLYDLRTDKIERSFLVAHGKGCGQTNGTPNGFSNVVNSNCSSEGIAVLGERAYSNWGINIKYWLQGLELSNSNMRKRVVVLHSWGGIPNVSIYPFRLVQSQGCFTISNRALSSLDKFVQRQDNKRIIFYAFKS